MNNALCATKKNSIRVSASIACYFIAVVRWSCGLPTQNKLCILFSIFKNTIICECMIFISKYRIGSPQYLLERRSTVDPNNLFPVIRYKNPATLCILISNIFSIKYYNMVTNSINTKYKAYINTRDCSLMLSKFRESISNSLKIRLENN